MGFRFSSLAVGVLAAAIAARSTRRVGAECHGWRACDASADSAAVGGDAVFAFA